MKLNLLLCFTASFSIFSISTSATTVLASTYKVTEVLDGDTIKVVDIESNKVKKVRLACIDAPEDSQPQGRLSTVTLNAFIPVGATVELNEVDTDRYKRSVSEVLKNGVNVNLSMLKKGQAVVYHRYLSNCPNGSAYIDAENTAKTKKVGFWNDSTFITPEYWRRGERTVVSKPQRVINQPISNGGRGYVAGSCKYLRTLGLSRFTPGDPNYTRRRDRDGDGIACE